MPVIFTNDLKRVADALLKKAYKLHSGGGGHPVTQCVHCGSSADSMANMIHWGGCVVPIARKMYYDCAQAHLAEGGK